MHFDRRRVNCRTIGLFLQSRSHVRSPLFRLLTIKHAKNGFVRKPYPESLLTPPSGPPDSCDNAHLVFRPRSPLCPLSPLTASSGRALPHLRRTAACFRSSDATGRLAARASAPPAADAVAVRQKKKGGVRMIGHRPSGSVMDRRRATFPRAMAQYHRRRGSSPSCSGWERVLPPRCGHRPQKRKHHSSVDAERVRRFVVADTESCSAGLRRRTGRR